MRELRTGFSAAIGRDHFEWEILYFGLECTFLLGVDCGHIFYPTRTAAVLAVPFFAAIARPSDSAQGLKNLLVIAILGLL